MLSIIIQMQFNTSSNMDPQDMPGILYRAPYALMKPLMMPLPLVQPYSRPPIKHSGMPMMNTAKIFVMVLASMICCDLNASRDMSH